MYERGIVMCNVYGYMRISTAEERDLQKYTRQEKALQKYAQDNKLEYALTFKEDKSGKSFVDRKAWQTLESIVKTGDTIVFKDICRFTRQAEEGYNKYMKLLNMGVELVFIDNPTVSTAYIRQLLDIANRQSIVAKTSLESTVKLLLIVELDRAEQERAIIVQRIKDGIKASTKKSGKKQGSLDKLTEELKTDIKALLSDRSIKYIDLMNKHNISRNTLKKYVSIIQEQQQENN